MPGPEKLWNSSPLGCYAAGGGVHAPTIVAGIALQIGIQRSITFYSDFRCRFTQSWAVQTLDSVCMIVFGTGPS